MNFLGTLGRNALWGIRYGAVFGLIYSALAVVIFLLGGQEAFAKQGTTFGEIIVFYLVGGVVAGAIVGMLRPLTYHRLGAAFVGVVGSISLAFGMRPMLGGLQSWTQVDTVFVVLFSLLFIFADKSTTSGNS